jgi:hypothetical protein
VDESHGRLVEGLQSYPGATWTEDLAVGGWRQQKTLEGGDVIANGGSRKTWRAVTSRKNCRAAV